MKLKILFAVSALILALPALGHDVAKGPNGGRVVQAGDYHVELVARSNVIEVFLTDTGDKPVPPAGFQGRRHFAGRRQKRPHRVGAGRRHKALGKSGKRPSGPTERRGADHRAERENRAGEV